jgi:YHS domain-containing protein
MNNSKAMQCPVCGMQLDDEPYSAEYLKMTFHFCSEQCRENFLDHPGLYSSGRARQHGGIIKRRRLRLSTHLPREDAELVKQRLRAMMGVHEIEIEGWRLTIRYDLLQLKLAQIEKAFEAMDAGLDNGWWQRLRRAWVHNTETNELNNISAGQGACCSRPPPRVSGR